jgi:hypothetical protein
MTWQSALIAGMAARGNGCSTKTTKKEIFSFRKHAWFLAH